MHLNGLGAFHVREHPYESLGQDASHRFLTQRINIVHTNIRPTPKTLTERLPLL